MAGIGHCVAVERTENGYLEAKRKSSPRQEGDVCYADLRCCFNRLKREKDVNQFNEDKINDNAIILTLMKQPILLAYIVTPFQRNRRLTSQQGTFLLHGDINYSFMDNLKVMIKDSSEPRLYRICIQVTQQERNTLLDKLHDMGISQTTLFPDLYGLATSLRHRMAYPDKLGIKAEPTDKSLRELFNDSQNQ